MRPLRTGVTRTDMAVDADLAEQFFVVQIIGPCIPDLVDEARLATQRHRQPSVLTVAAEDGPIRRSAYREKSFPFRQFNELRGNNSGGAERGMDIPDWTGAAVFRQGKRGLIEPF